RLASHAIVPVIEDTLAALMVPGDEREVVVRLQERLPEVNIDSSKMQQALTNVLSNAYKYSPDGGEIVLEGLVQEHEIGIRVSDHGMGMTPEQCARAFERFFRADTSGRIPGTGLGLSLVKEILEIHGGRVELTSEYGIGTQITLWLPAVSTEGMAEAGPAAA
ncbi:MAG: sensor histidine kinase, partial [Zoogloea sp.]|nr:sensor histidine kinase [Zoogloea sp.]